MRVLAKHDKDAPQFTNSHIKEEISQPRTTKCCQIRPGNVPLSTWSVQLSTWKRHVSHCDQSLKYLWNFLIMFFFPYYRLNFVHTQLFGHRDVKTLLKYIQLSCSSPNFFEQRWKSTKFCQQFFVWLVYGNLASNGAVCRTTSVIPPSPSSPMVPVYLWRNV